MEAAPGYEHRSQEPLFTTINYIQLIRWEKCGSEQESLRLCSVLIETEVDKKSSARPPD